MGITARRQRHLFTVTSAVAVAGITAAQPVRAQESTALEAEPPVEEIVVTAQKRNETVNSVPMSITALTGENLRNQGIKDVADLAKLVPGLTYVQSGFATPVYDR